ncbi:MAG: hypothetical protein K2P86_05030 [Xanthobacteraceae bacterium]|nr:hypothetical protein [Xanthobacteraceae bacterium]
MRAGIVAIFFFAGTLALGHYVAAPFFCRGGIVIPTLDAKALCGADLHLNRSGSVLLYFGSIAIAFLFGLIASLLPSRAKQASDAKSEKNHAETFEQIVAATEAKQTPAANPSAAAAPASTAAVPASTSASTPAPKPTPVVPGPSQADAAVAAAVLSGAPADKKPAAEPEKKAEPAPAAAPQNPATAAAADAITVGLAVAMNGSRGAFDGTNQELLERFRELKKQESVNSIAQAQRLLDESTFSALSKGVDPKQHLSEIAHLVLAEDPDLKSGVVRGVVVHIAARLKELGVVQKIPSPAKPAA